MNRFLTTIVLWLLGNHILFTTTEDGKKCVSPGIWSWVCYKVLQGEGICVKVAINYPPAVVELQTCKLTCGAYSTLFPRPSGFTRFGEETVPFLPSNVKLNELYCNSIRCTGKVRFLLMSAYNNLHNLLTNQHATNMDKQKHEISEYCQNQAKVNKFSITIRLTSRSKREKEEVKLTLDTDEHYNLYVSKADGGIDVIIDAANFFGARHALETLSQLITYRQSHSSLQIVNSARIVRDKPAYPYRGLLLDTSRNYFSVDSILKLITTMSYNKMNTLHWHITDSQSFPIEIPGFPEFTNYGAYSADRVYTHEDVKRITSHALVHGVRILPEFDQPAHVGEGWQWGPDRGYGNLTVCFRQQPRKVYCPQQPCGQLNPANNKVYEVLEKIYDFYMKVFDPDLFHAGGDEINFNCWNSSEEVVNYMKKRFGGAKTHHFYRLWGEFIMRSSEKIYKANNNKELPLVLWSSYMTSRQYLTKYLNPEKHIIQIWSHEMDRSIPRIIKSGFRTIFSNHDRTYLDCGFGDMWAMGNNWCSPYKDWKTIYESDPLKVLYMQGIKITKRVRDQILGQEAAMWSEQVDEHSSEGKIWPRTAALAERLWSNPSQGWRSAEYRFVHHRERMVERGVRADAIQPLWCHQNSGFCV